MKLLQLLVFAVLQIPFVPFAIVGLVLAGYLRWVVTKRLGVSYTAAKAIQNRWVLHVFGVRPDPETVRFMQAMPTESSFGFWLLVAPAVVANRLTGYLPAFAQIPDGNQAGPTNFINWRTAKFDRILTEQMPKVEQVVNLGAGYDLRVLQSTKGREVRAFEMDRSRTQSFKRDVMTQAGIAHEWVTYVPIDFEAESWVEGLEAAGFDRSKKTLFHWESVSVYLDEEVVRKTLSEMSELAAPGSVLSCDWYGTGFTNPTRRALKKSIDGLKKLGEPIKFGVDMSDPRATVDALLSETNFAVSTCDTLKVSIFGDDPFYMAVVAERVLV